MKIIDAHCHIGEGRYKHLKASELIVQMDKHGIDKAVVCPVEEHITVYNQEGNDYILQAVKEYPDRLIGFATVNPWYGTRAVEELERAIGEGLRGLKLNSTLQGYFINDELVYPLVEAAQKMDIPVYFHTATPIFSLPLQLADLAGEFPEVRFIMGHSAASDFWIDAAPATRMHDNIYLESSLRSGSAVLQHLVDELGADRLMFGSDTPASTISIELAKIDSLELSPADKEMVLAGTVLRVLGEV
jgi:predicted TIM-barrel fold metal-dependent hydrolase